MVVMSVPDWATEPEVGIASPLNAPEHNFRERLSRFGVRCCNAYEELRYRMGPRGFKLSNSIFVIVRHIISGQAGRRGVVIFNEKGVAFASVTGARDLYAFEYPSHLLSDECFLRVRASAD